MCVEGVSVCECVDVRVCVWGECVCESHFYGRVIASFPGHSYQMAWE